MTREIMIHNWLRFLAVAVGFPFLLFMANILFIHDQTIWGDSNGTIGTLCVIWLVAMWVTFPDSAVEVDETLSRLKEIDVRLVAQVPGSIERLYSDASMKALPEVGAEIGLGDPDSVLSETVVGKVTKVIPLSHETDEGSNQAVFLDVTAADLETLDRLGWNKVG
jgi:hypothetical protein